MSDLTPPKRRVGGVLLAALIGVALLGTSGCDRGQPPAATVNGHEISQKQVQDDLDAEVAAAKKGGGTPNGFYGTGKADTYSMEAADGKLSALILDQLIVDELARLGKKPNKADADGAEAALCGQGNTGCLNSYPAAYKKRLLAQQTDLNAYIRVEPSSQTGAPSTSEITAEAQQQYQSQLASDPSALDLVCYRAAQFTDQATADTAKAQVQGGADIDAAASANGGQPGGQESCGLVSSLTSQSAPTELTSGKAGDVFTYDAQSAVLVLQVTARRTATFDDIKAELVQSIQSQVQQQNSSARSAALKKAVIKLATKAKVTVNPKYGSYDARTFQVVPPPLPQGVTTTTTAPANPSGSSTTGG